MNKKDYLDKISKYNMVGSSICLMDKNNKRSFFQSGYASLETKEVSKRDSIYRIASISKVIVAIGLLKLKDKGLVDIDEDISLYLGYKVCNPKYKDVKITLRMVMTQTASFRDSLGYNHQLN